jgi:hypothetical protein
MDRRSQMAVLAAATPDRLCEDPQLAGRLSLPVVLTRS